MKLVAKLILVLFYFSLMSKSNAQVPDNAADICPLLIGETLPKASLQDVDGELVNLSSILKSKPTVLVFYRGGWCPYCNLQLSGLVTIEKEIVDLGYQIVAISPDDYKNLKTTEENKQLNYALYSDMDGKFIQDIGIAFSTPILMRAYITTKKQKGKTSDVLPVPSVMVVNTDGVILFEYINPNYKERISSEMLLAVLNTLNK